MLIAFCPDTRQQAGEFLPRCIAFVVITDLSMHRIFSNLTFGSSAAFLPMVDGVTLTDTITRLFKAGKVANVAVIAGTVNDEGAGVTARNTTVLTPATSGIWNLSSSQVNKAASYYPVNATFGYASPDNFFLSGFKAFIQALSPFGEPGITGSERLVGRYMSQAFGANNVWTFRFNAPGKSQPFHSPQTQRQENLLTPQ